MNHGEIVSFLWSVANLIRDSFKRGKYRDIILQLTVLRRLDCVLAETKEAVLKRQAELSKRGLQDLDKALRAASGLAFYNTSRYDFDKLLGDAPQVAANLRNYIAGFSRHGPLRRSKRISRPSRMTSGRCSRRCGPDREEVGGEANIGTCNEVPMFDTYCECFPVSIISGKRAWGPFSDHVTLRRTASLTAASRALSLMEL